VPHGVISAFQHFSTLPGFARQLVSISASCRSALAR
jgi:hypothetical protein